MLLECTMDDRNRSSDFLNIEKRPSGFRKGRAFVNYFYQLIYDLKVEITTKEFESIFHDLLLYCLLEKSMRKKKIRWLKLFAKTGQVSIRLNGIRKISYNQSLAFPKEMFYHPCIASIFSRDFLENYETKYKYASDSTNLCSPSESIRCSDTPEEFFRKWRLVKNDHKAEQMFFNVQNTASQYLIKLSGV